MRRRSFFVLFLLFSMAGFFIFPVQTQDNSIVIREDGTVDGTNQIQRMGNCYTFLGNIIGSISVEKNDVVIDGAGYSLKSNGDIIGINLSERNNVTVTNLTVMGFLGTCGILLEQTVNCEVFQNCFTENHIGISLNGKSSQNSIVKNHIFNNTIGMESYGGFFPGSNNEILENEVSNNSIGMQIQDFLDTKISGNSITFNKVGLGLGVGSGSIVTNNTMNNNTFGFRAFNVQGVNVNVDYSNIVNGKPICYWVNKQDETVPTNVCYVALIGCSNIKVENLNLTGSFEAVFLGSTKKTRIANNIISKNSCGIKLDASSDNTITKNVIEHNKEGILIQQDCVNNAILENNITSNSLSGISISDAKSNNIIGNKITNNNQGVFTQNTEDNTFHHNNFVNNTQSWHDIALMPWPTYVKCSVNIWDDGKEGNYWDNHNGTDNNNDGIGDSPYVLNENNQDNYPLMEKVLFDSPPKDDSLENDTFTEFSANLIGFVTSEFGAIILGATLLVVVLIATLVIVTKQKASKSAG